MRTLGLYGLAGSGAVRLTRLRSPGCANPVVKTPAPLVSAEPSYAAPALGAVAPNPTASEVPATPRVQRLNGLGPSALNGL